MDIATPVAIAQVRRAAPPAEAPRERLRRVFETTCEALYRFILVRVGGNRHAADDLLQQVCEAAAGKRGLPDESDACEAYLRGMARNLLRRYWRKARRSPVHVPIEDAAAARQLVEDMESRPLPPEALARKEIARHLMLAITSLSASEQQLVFSFYFEGCSHADIAAQGGVSVKSIETRLYRVRERLRRILRQIDEGELT
jgi:RNA polymerase sigma-70 factor (ECF subfamily)